MSRWCAHRRGDRQQRTAVSQPPGCPHPCGQSPHTKHSVSRFSPFFFSSPLSLHDRQHEEHNPCSESSQFVLDSIEPPPLCSQRSAWLLASVLFSSCLCLYVRLCCAALTSTSHIQSRHAATFVKFRARPPVGFKQPSALFFFRFSLTFIHTVAAQSLKHSRCLKIEASK